jgi:hypothetical protein
MKLKNIQLTTLLLTLSLSSSVIAEEAVKNEHKNNGTGHAVSNADHTSNTGRSVTVDVDTTTSNDQQSTRLDSRSRHEQMQQRRREMQAAQLDAYKKHLQNRKQNEQAYDRQLNSQLPPEAQARRKAYLKLIEDRRALMDKMVQQQRQEAEERRKLWLQKMNQTSTSPEQAKTA